MVQTISLIMLRKSTVHSNCALDGPLFGVATLRFGPPARPVNADLMRHE